MAHIHSGASGARRGQGTLSGTDCKVIVGVDETVYLPWSWRLATLINGITIQAGVGAGTVAVYWTLGSKEQIENPVFQDKIPWTQVGAAAFAANTADLVVYAVNGFKLVFTGAQELYLGSI